MARHWAPLSATLLLSACASQVLIPADERVSLERELSGRGRDRYLRLSYFVTPFFGDASKRLLSPVPPAEVRLLEEPGGASVSPGAVQGIASAGSRVRILKVEFPTAYAMAERVPYTPRHQPWLYLEIDGQPTSRPIILPLRPQIRNGREFHAEVDRYLTREDPAPMLAAFPENVQQAIREKAAVIDMPAEALELSWGYPERKQVRYEGAVKQEEWHYADDRRVATLADGRVTELRGGGAKER